VKFSVSTGTGGSVFNALVRREQMRNTNAKYGMKKLETIKRSLVWRKAYFDTLYRLSVTYECDGQTDIIVAYAALHYVTWPIKWLQIIKYIYTVNHKKRDILFLTITLANLNRFL